jgi:uncharacterized protein (TIGR02246 family)
VSRRHLAILALPLLAACPSAPSPEAEAEAIRAVLDGQAAAWNAGDLEAFMARGYLPSEDLVFTSGGVVRKGYDATLERYQARYADSAAMGRLEFSDVEITLLGPGSAVVYGRWKLEREGGASGGVFTLVFAKTRAGWRIVHDHTSLGPEDAQTSP